MTERRKGDAIAIPGDYQHRALEEGHPVQRFWHLSKQLAVAQLLPTESWDLVLDVGCGSGTVSAYLGKSGATVVGVDGNAEAVSFATETYGAPNISFQRGLVDEHFSTERPVDKIYCMEVIEHIYEDQGRAMLDVFRDLLRPSGKVLLTTPNYRSMWPVIEWGLDRFTGAASLQESQHVAFYTRTKLRKLCEEAGFKVNFCGSMCGLAPWIAPFGFGLAKTMHHLELRRPHPFGSILTFVLEKPD